MRYVDIDAFLEELPHMLGVKSLDYLTEQERWFVEKLLAAPFLDWTACSEHKPPSEITDYLITDGENMVVGSYRDDADSWENINYGWLERDAISDPDYNLGIGKVVAWMPLPKQFSPEK